MKLIANAVVTPLVIFFAFIPTCFAMSMGFYVGGSLGKAEIDAEYGRFSADEDTDLSVTAIGLVFDSNVAMNRVFNYRLNLGFEGGQYDFDDFDAEFDLGRFTMDHHFGFGMVRTPHLRIWMGPQIRLTYMEGETESDNDFYAYGIGLGPVAGTNIHVAPNLSLCLTGGIRWTYYNGEVDDVSVFRSIDADFETAEREAYLRLALLFRWGDMFASSY